MSGLNPNVFFELGIRTAMNKPICLTIDEATKDPPFDLETVNHHPYVSDLRPWVLPVEVEKLAAHIKESAKSTENALWKYFSLRVKAVISESPGPADKLDLLVTEFDALRKQIGEANILARQEPSSFDVWTDHDSVRRDLRQITARRDALLAEARTRGIVVTRHELYGDGKIAFGIKQGAKRSDIVALRDLADQLGVQLRIDPLASIAFCAT